MYELINLLKWPVMLTKWIQYSLNWLWNKQFCLWCKCLLNLNVFLVLVWSIFNSLCLFVRVSSLVGGYFYNMYIVKCLKLCFPLMLRTIIYFHVYIILDFSITYRNASVLCQSECAWLHKTVNTAVFFVKSNENTHANVQSCPSNEKRK